jgi:3D (Asp-Asp-Asp) domain-containing protein
MNKLTEIICFCLNKAKIITVLVVLALNMPVQEIAAASNVPNVKTLFNNATEKDENSLLITSGDSVLGINILPAPKILKVILTAYSSTVDQTDSTPFITASGAHVRDGTVAANFLAFGTKVKIPEIFGDKVFTVEDRMAKKHDGKMDIWFPQRYLAKRFGVQEADVVILD